MSEPVPVLTTEERLAALETALTQTNARLDRLEKLTNVLPARPIPEEERGLPRAPKRPTEPGEGDRAWGPRTRVVLDTEREAQRP